MDNINTFQYGMLDNEYKKTPYFYDIMMLNEVAKEKKLDYCIIKYYNFCIIFLIVIVIELFFFLILFIFNY